MTATIVLPEKLDANAAHELREAVLSADLPLVLSCERVQQVGGLGLQVLLSALRNDQVTLSAVSEAMDQAFSLFGVRNILEETS